MWSSMSKLYDSEKNYIVFFMCCFGLFEIGLAFYYYVFLLLRNSKHRLIGIISMAFS